MVRVMVDLEPIPGALNVRQERTNSHVGGTLCSQYTFQHVTGRRKETEDHGEGT